jgi:ribose transport system substrate-binding protein
MRKILLWSLVVTISIAIVSVFSIVGCAAEEVAEEAEEAAEEEVVEEEAGEAPVVVLLNIGMQSAYPPLYSSSLEENLKEAGIDYFMYDGKFDAQTQAGQMDDAIAINPDAIVLFAADSAAMASGIKKAYDAGIPVIMGNSEPTEESMEYTSLYFGPNNYKEGNIAGEEANNILGDSGNIVIIEGTAGQQTSIARTDGFVEVLNEGFNVLGAQPADWQRDEGNRVMSDFLTSYGDEIDLIWSHGDDMGTGAGIAMKEAGLEPGEINHVSLGGSKGGLQTLADGWIQKLIIQAPDDEADQLAPFVIKIVEEDWEAGKQWDPYWNYMETPVADMDTYEQYLPGY